MTDVVELASIKLRFPPGVRHRALRVGRPTRLYYIFTNAESAGVTINSIRTGGVENLAVPLLPAIMFCPNGVVAFLEGDGWPKLLLCTLGVGDELSFEVTDDDVRPRRELIVDHHPIKHDGAVGNMVRRVRLDDTPTDDLIIQIEGIQSTSR